MHKVLVNVNRLGGLSLPRKIVVRLTNCPDMTLDVYRGRKTTTQQQLHPYHPEIISERAYNLLDTRCGFLGYVLRKFF